MELTGRSVIVTGGASGIGRATALLLAREGARIFIGDIDEEGGRSAAAEGAAAGLAVEFLPLDLTSAASIDNFVAAVHGQVEPIDGLVNAAGWDTIQPFLDNPPEMWDRVDRDQPDGRDPADPGGVAADGRGARRQDRQHIERCRVGSAAPARRFMPPPRVG